MPTCTGLERRASLGRPNSRCTSRKWTGDRASTASMVAIALLTAASGTAISKQGSDVHLKGYDIAPTGLKPKYPAGYRCSPLTSLYASWIDVDGSRRSEPHSGVDGGRLGDSILAPGPGVVRAVWRADWGWGSEGALLIRHSPRELNLNTTARYFYSEFDHLRYSDLTGTRVGQRITRGRKLARVFRPGGKPKYLPEVHWEVWEISGNDKLRWAKNHRGGPYWINETARLIDPLYMLSRQSAPSADGVVLLMPYEPEADYSHFRGFTYILPCGRNHQQHAQEPG